LYISLSVLQEFIVMHRLGEHLILDVVPKLVAAFIDSLMFFSKDPLGDSEARGPGFTGKEKNIGESTHATNFGTNPDFKKYQYHDQELKGLFGLRFTAYGYRLQVTGYRLQVTDEF